MKKISNSCKRNTKGTPVDNENIPSITFDDYDN